jgi:hypothetical protein
MLPGQALVAAERQALVAAERQGMVAAERQALVAAERQGMVAAERQALVAAERQALVAAERQGMVAADAYLTLSLIMSQMTLQWSRNEAHQEVRGCVATHISVAVLLDAALWKDLLL